MCNIFNHIDEGATFLQFGYVSDDLKQMSSKKIIVICIDCTKSREIRECVLYTSKNNAKRCNNCQRAKHIVYVRNDFTGTKKSEETKRKIGESNKVSQPKGKLSKLYQRVVSEAEKQATRKRNKERVWSDKSKEKLSKSHAGKKLSAEHIQKKIVAQTGERNHRYGKPAAHGHGQYFSATTGAVIWVRSGWELKTAQFLDENNFNWLYEPEAFPILYEYSGQTKQGTYRPDFKIEKDGFIEYWEIKGFWRDDAKVKYEAFVNQYPQIHIRLLQKDDLKTIGIITKK